MTRLFPLVVLVLVVAPAGGMLGCSGTTTVPSPPRKVSPQASEWQPIGRTQAAANDTFTLTSTPVPGLPDFRTPGNPVVRLDVLPGRVLLPVVSQPQGLADLEDDFVVDHKEMPNPRNMARKLMVLSANLPFSFAPGEAGFRPDGMTVSVEGKVVPFSRGPAPKADDASWRISSNGKQVVLSYPTMPPPGSVTIHWPLAREVVGRNDPAWINDTHTVDQFVSASVTVAGDTYNGLRMVAPTTMEWDLTLPAVAPRFIGWVGIEAPPISSPATDGATLVVEVVSDGVSAEAGQLLVPSAGPPERWTVDLSRWAGKAVTLRLRSDPGAEATFDWLYVGGPIVSAGGSAEPRRVVVVAMDTTRPDHFSFNGYERPTTPELDRVLGQALVFDHTWSTAPRTRPSFRSSTTGRLPLDAVGATNIGDVFRQHGFATAGIVANTHLQPRFDFDDGFDLWSFDGVANARQQVDHGLQWLKANQDHDSYLFLHFMDPHMAYDAPAAFREKFVEKPSLAPKLHREAVLKWMANGTLTDEQKQELEGLHDGEMAFMSQQLGRFFAELDQLPGRTLVVVHSDHGEEFWEHGGFEHNHSLYDELVRTMLAFRPSGGAGTPGRLPVASTLMDVAPTLYDLFGFVDAPMVDGRSLVPAMAGTPEPARALPVGYLQYAHERWGVVMQGKKYILHTGSGEEELYDLDRDPNETVNLAAQTDLGPYREQLSKVHGGLKVGSGYRLHVSVAPNSAPIRFSLPEAATGADVLDPESLVEHRANIEWGERPKKTARAVGTVELADDGRTVVFTPGAQPQGVLWVLFDPARLPAPGAAVRVEQNGAVLPLAALDAAPPMPNGRPRAAGRCPGVCVVPGTIVVPPLPEAVMIAKSRGGASDMEMLKLLGYTAEGAEEPEAGSTDDPPSDDEDIDHEGG